MLFFYVRHGDPIYDPNQLTPLGKRQAEAVAKRLAMHGIDEIYASTSQRAIETAQPTCEILKKEMTLLDFANEIYAICKDTARGVLIFSPPGGGKTTALRSLARSLSRDRRVVIVDEREEIYTDELLDREIDVLSGYRRGYGISLATRSLSPDVILTDEISAEDATEVLLASNSGVPIIATAHAASVAELMRREGMRRLFECGVFGSAVGIYRSLGGFFCREESVECRA